MNLLIFSLTFTVVAKFCGGRYGCLCWLVTKMNYYYYYLVLPNGNALLLYSILNLVLLPISIDVKIIVKFQLFFNLNPSPIVTIEIVQLSSLSPIVTIAPHFCLLCRSPLHLNHHHHPPLSLSHFVSFVRDDKNCPTRGYLG